MDPEEKLAQIIQVLDQLAEDTSVPRNIRRGAVECKDRLMKRADALDVRTATTIFKLDEMANDPNLPLHGRTMLWGLISQLEQVK
jgi:uncharacterized protein (UPF0147 family)